jgi:hypothetical protein
MVNWPTSYIAVLSRSCHCVYFYCYPYRIANRALSGAEDCETAQWPMQADEKLKGYDVLAQHQFVSLLADDLGLIWTKRLYRLAPTLSVSYSISTSLDTRSVSNHGIVCLQAHPTRMTRQG